MGSHLRKSTSSARALNLTGRVVLHGSVATVVFVTVVGVDVLVVSSSLLAFSLLRGGADTASALVDTVTGGLLDWGGTLARLAGRVPTELDGHETIFLTAGLDSDTTHLGGDGVPL